MSEFEFYIDQKVTVWRREHVYVNAESEKEAVGKCLDGEYETEDTEYLYDSEEDMIPSENNDNSTFEIVDYHENVLYSNSPKIPDNACR